MQRVGPDGPASQWILLCHGLGLCALSFVMQRKDSWANDPGGMKPRFTFLCSLLSYTHLITQPHTQGPSAAAAERTQTRPEKSRSRASSVGLRCTSYFKITNLLCHQLINRARGNRNCFRVDQDQSAVSCPSSVDDSSDPSSRDKAELCLDQPQVCLYLDPVVTWPRPACRIKLVLSSDVYDDWNISLTLVQHQSETSHVQVCCSCLSSSLRRSRAPYVVSPTLSGLGLEESRLAFAVS